MGQPRTLATLTLNGNAIQGGFLPSGQLGPSRAIRARVDRSANPGLVRHLRPWGPCPSNGCYLELTFSSLNRTQIRTATARMPITVRSNSHTGRLCVHNGS